MILLKNLILEIRLEPRGHTVEDCYDLAKKVDAVLGLDGTSSSKFFKEKGYYDLWEKDWEEECSQKELNIIYKLLLQCAKENNISIN